MKYFSRQTRSLSGFTLVEMLVVIAIIAILAGVLAVAAGPAINAAKRAKANVTANQIQTAIMNYYTEYGVYPITTGVTTDTSLTSGGAETGLMNALCGNINAYNASAVTPSVPNTRQIAYLTPKVSDVDTSGVLLNPMSTLSNPAYFSIAMDSDYSGILGDSGGAAPPNFATASPGSACPPTGGNITQGVAVWACCDPNYITNPGGSTSPQFWVHTY